MHVYNMYTHIVDGWFPSSALMEYRARPNARSKEYLIIEHVTRHVWEAPAAIF